MKKVFLLVLMCAVTGIMTAQTVHDNELAIVYYMPQTQLCFDVEYEEIILHKGPFTAYAKQYLGETEVIEEDNISFRIVAIHPHTKAVPDYTKAYKVVAEQGVETQLLSLTSMGTLAGYNFTPSDRTPRRNAQDDKCRPMPPRDLHPQVMPLLEDHLTGGKSIAQQAQGAAKLIYRIRENRMYLLGGEVDKVPADGQAMKLVLDELNHQERQLVELFTGYREVKRHHKKLSYTPVKTEEVELGYFSEKDGFTNGNGEPILLNIAARRQTKGAPRTDDKKAPVPSQIYYNLPGSANYKVLYLNEVFLESNAQIAQFGIALPLAKNLFTGSQLPHIQFDTKTGNIKSIEK